MMVHSFNPSTEDVDFLSSRIAYLPTLQSEFKDSQVYIEKPCLYKWQSMEA